MESEKRIMTRFKNIAMAAIIGVTSVFAVTTPANAATSKVDKAIAKYRQIVEKEEKQYNIKKMVSLIYVDGDNVPELVTSNDASTDLAMPVVYSYHNGKVKDAFLGGYAAGTCYASDLKYVPKKGYLYLTSEHRGINHIFIRLKSGKFSQIKFIDSSDKSTLLVKYKNKYAKGAKKVRMYDSLDAAKKALKPALSAKTAKTAKLSDGN